MIGKRGVPNPNIRKERRIKYAMDILQKELLPHVGIGENCEQRKGYFLGYVVHRLLLAATLRRNLDDRDHYGNKRLDLAGPLMAFLFRTLFKRLIKDVKLQLRKVISKKPEWSMETLISPSIIHNGLKYSLATGTQ